MEIVGLAVLIVYTIFSCLQWLQIRWTNRLTREALDGNNAALHQTLGKLQGQIEAAKTANQLIKQSMVATQSAAVIVESPRPFPFSSDIELLKQQGIYLYFANIGVSPASKFEAVAVFTRRSLPTYTVIGEPESEAVTAQRITPGERMPSGISGFRTDDVHLAFETKSFTSQDLARLTSLEEVAELTGSFTYEDGFGNKRRQPFCFLYATFPRHTFTESGAATGGAEGSWGLCVDMRRYITQAEKWKAEDEKMKQEALCA